ncbi:MAG: SurA N-terminal domain-containing protein [Bacteroidota bacterium]
MRNKMGKFVVFAVGVAILLFIVSDLTGPGSLLLNSNDNSIGEIAGDKVDYEQFNQTLDQLKYEFALQNGRSPSNNEINSLRQRAWDLTIVKVAFQKQYDQIGLEVTKEEVVDMVQGKNISPELMSAPAFQNPETGQFDKNLIVNYLRNINQLPPQQQAVWYSFEQNLKPARLRLKFDNLLLNTSFVTTEEAKKQYLEENTVAEVKYLYVPYYSIPDSAISYSDSDLQKYLNENADEYEAEESTEIQYVTFPVIASSADSAFHYEDLTALKAEFERAENDSLFAKLNTDGSNFFFNYRKDELPQVVLNDTDLSVGQIYGPEQENSLYKLYKVSDVYEDSVFSIKASHILFKAADDSDEAKQEARKEAQNVLNEIKAGADFAQKAQEHGTDGTASRGGDLGWFSEGRMVDEFNQAVFNYDGVGLLNNLVETSFGFHIIKVTEPKTNEKYKISVVEREIAPRDETIDQAFRKADYFAGTTESLSEFTTNAQRDSLSVRTAQKLNKNQDRVNNLNDAREIVRWTFNDGEVGQVSDVFELDASYVVAALVGKTEKGVSDLESVRIRVENEVKNEKKAEAIKEKLAGLSGTLDEIAEAYGSDATINSKSDLKMNEQNLPGVGQAPEAIGAAFALQPGSRSVEIEGSTGVIIMELENVTEPGEIADYSTYKTQIASTREGRASFNLSQLINEKADIKDKRYKFF